MELFPCQSGKSYISRAFIFVPYLKTKEIIVLTFQKNLEKLSDADKMDISVSSWIWDIH